MSIDEVMAGILEYGILSRRATVSELRSFRTSIKVAIEQHVAEAVAKEREACAKACESQSARWFRDHSRMYVSYECAAAIRARAEKETK